VVLAAAAEVDAAAASAALCDPLTFPIKVDATAQTLRMPSTKL
jgi:hypothetical protein